MSSPDPKDRNELVDMIAQAVVDRLEERERVSRLADLVVTRVLALQAEEEAIREQEQRENAAPDKRKAPSRRPASASEPKTTPRK